MTNHSGKETVPIKDRVRGALWGGLVGDAYCLGCHWIYSLNEIELRFPDGIAGFETPYPEHYHAGKKSGDFTHYGEAAVLMLESIAKCGRFDAADFGSSFIRYMSDENYKGYRDHATKGTIANFLTHLDECKEEPFDYQQGADDDQPATLTHLAPVVAMHLNTKDLLDTVAKATMVCQNNIRAVTYAQAFTLVLQNLLNGSTPEFSVAETRMALKSLDGAWSEVNKRMKIACAARILSVIDATILFGQSCSLYSSFTAALHATLYYTDNFAKAIQTTAQAGGDSAGRACMIGTWLGAYLGIDAIPKMWRNRLNAYDRINASVERIVAGMNF